MLDRDRLKLLGTYRTPPVRVGTVLSCECRHCDVIIVGYTDAKIAWPVGRRKGGGGRDSLVVFGDLIKAIRQESNQAVAFWFGVIPRSVSRCRKALGVPTTNAGTLRLRQEHSKDEWFKAMQAKAQSTPWTEERRRKLSKLFRGKPRPRHVIEAMRKGRTGRPHPPEVREKIRLANLARNKK